MVFVIYISHIYKDNMKKAAISDSPTKNKTLFTPFGNSDTLPFLLNRCRVIAVKLSPRY